MHTHTNTTPQWQWRHCRVITRTTDKSIKSRQYKTPQYGIILGDIISFKKQADTPIYENKQSHTHPQAQSNYIDYWNNNKASIIDPLVLFAYEIQAMSNNQGHYSIAQKRFSSWKSQSRNSSRVINKPPFSTRKKKLARVFKPTAVSLPCEL